MALADLNAPHAPASRVAGLISRMRDGDRDAVAEFITAYRSRIRRRIRGKLDRNSPMRRLFDSDEIFSTVTRRLDLYVSQGRLQALTETDLWTLICRIADRAVIDKYRLFQRLEEREGPDSELARFVLARLRAADRRRRNGAVIEIHRVLAAMPDPIERQMLVLWLDGMPISEVADTLGLHERSARTRWDHMRSHLRVMFKRGLLG